MKTLILPSEILAVVEEGSKEKIPQAYLLDSKASSSRKKKAREYFRDHSEIIIPNSGFKIYLDEETSLFWKDFRVRIILEHPGLETLCKGGKVRTYIGVSEFFNLIGERGGNLQGFMIPGSFCIKDSGVMWISAVLENMLDSDFLEAKQAGQIRNGSMTSKWIPGHRYVMKNGNQVLYLGHVNSFAAPGNPTTWTMKDLLSCMDSSKYLYYYEPKEWGPGKLMITLSSPQAVEDIMKTKGENLTKAIIGQGWLGSGKTREYGTGSLFYRPDSSSKWVGCDMGEVWTLDPGVTENSIGTFIEDYALSVIGSFKGKYEELLDIPEEYRFLINFVADKVIPIWKDSWIRLEQSKWWRVNSYFFQKGSRSYYGRSEPIPPYDFENLKKRINTSDRGGRPSFSDEGLPYLPLTREEKDAAIKGILEKYQP